MKTWIIVLAIIFVVLWLAKNALGNYIKNDKTESLKYYYSQGTSKLGIWYGLMALVTTLVGAADVILLFIFLINKM